MVNPNGRHFGGWKDVVHDLSHWSAWKLFGNGKHTPLHAFIEKLLVHHVVSSGWLEGKLKREPKPKPTTSDLRALRLARIERRAKAWQAKAKRAATALKKIERQRRYYAKLAA